MSNSEKNEQQKGAGTTHRLHEVMQDTHGCVCRTKQMSFSNPNPFTLKDKRADVDTNWLLSCKLNKAFSNIVGKTGK